MTNQEFEAHVNDHAVSTLDLPYAALGLNGEAGEVAEWVKKVVLRGAPGDLTDQDLRYELGDVLWYVTRIAQIKNWTLSEVMAANVAKLDAKRATRGY